MFSQFPGRLIFAFILCLVAIDRATKAADAPAAPKTGEIDLTFSNRSPLSTRKEIARRLSLKDSEVVEDYDLSKRPFKTYVPKNYDPKVPCGLFFYAGYKDSVSVCSDWEPILDKSHLIFITPVCHHGDGYPNSVPLWQMVGLSFDAVENLKQQYAIDTHRLYLMTWAEGSMRSAFGSADIFTGLIVAVDGEYCQNVAVGDGKSYYKSDFPAPPAALFGQAKHRAVVLLAPDFADVGKKVNLTAAAMKRNGFTNLLGLQLTIDGDMHYPHMKTDWFENTVLPFMDKVAGYTPGAPAVVEPKPAISPPSPATSPTTPPANGTPPAPAATQPAVTAVKSNEDAQRLLRLSKLYIKNGQPALARTNLQLLLKRYPKDPAASEATTLLAKLPAE